MAVKMLHLIIQLGKYLNIIMILLYTLGNIWTLKGAASSKKKNSIMLTVLFYLLHISCYMQLYLQDMNEQLIVFYLSQVSIFIILQFCYKKVYRQMSVLLFRNMMLLLMLGFVILTRLNMELALKQFFSAVTILGISLSIPALISKLKLWSRLGIVYVLAGLGIMILLLIIGTPVNGATNWLVIGDVRLQPSEFVKLLFVFGIAYLLIEADSFFRLMLSACIAAAYVIVLVLERDLGGAFLFFITYVVMLCAATSKLRYLIAGLAAGAAASVCAYYIFPHIQTRISIYIDPFVAYESGGYQVAQSLFAIGTGGWLGFGLGQGIPNTIPVAESDFIFSAIIEEMGGIFAIAIIAVYIICFILFVNISVKLKDTFYKLVGLGFAMMMMFQTLLNIGGVTKFIPLTGVTLPLVSYGGSSLVATVIMFSILQGMYTILQREKKEAAEVNVSLESEKTDEVTARNKSVSRYILALTYVVCAIFAGLVVYMSYYIEISSTEVIKNSYNKRQQLLADQIIRGDIISSDGVILAETITNNEGEEERVYPYGSMYAHAVGRIMYGMTGVEAAMNQSLYTSDINTFEKLINEVSDRKNPGNSVILTLDSRLQSIAYKALGDHKGAVVVVEPSTGRILAMVSKPDYDPGNEEQLLSLLAQKDTSAPLMNRATQGLYPPGSTFKLLTLLEYIRENDDYNSFNYVCTGEERQNMVTIHCAGNIRHGEESLMNAFANSCNSAFTKLGCTLDMDRLHKLAEDFMYNKALPGSLGAQMSSYVLDGSSQKTDIPQSVIGLGKTLISPLHNALIAASVANGGVMMTPFLTDRVVNDNGTVMLQTETKAYMRIMSEEEADLLCGYMAAVVEDGTAGKLNEMSISVAGKTGTAIYYTGMPAHAWFIGFAPVDEPKLAISVLVESAGSGSGYAVPIAKQILEEYIRIVRNID